MQKHLDIEQIIKNAEKETRKRAFKLWLISKFIPKAKQGMVYLLHSYLRWLDDFVDDPSNHCEEKRKIIKQQYNLIRLATCSSQFTTEYEKEYYLFFFIRHLVENNQLYFLQYINNIINSFEMDVARLQAGGIFFQSELEQYLKLLNEATFRLSLAFIPSLTTPEKLNGYIGTFFWYVLSIRDFEEDVKAGFINLSHEEIQKYNINPNNILEDSNRFVWLKEKFHGIINLLAAESETLMYMPIRVKIIWLPSYFNLLWELNRLKYYNFRFALSIKKNYLKEFASYLEAFIICLKFSIRVLNKIK